MQSSELQTDLWSLTGPLPSRPRPPPLATAPTPHPPVIPRQSPRRLHSSIDMCGIVGYIGPNPGVPVIMEGLARLEYRGYDSAGIAVAGGPEGLQLRRAPGKL